MTQPEEIAATVLFLISAQASHVTGSTCSWMADMSTSIVH